VDGRRSVFYGMVLIPISKSIVLTREIHRVSVESIFQTHIDRLAKLISELFHLELNEGQGHY